MRAAVRHSGWRSQRRGPWPLAVVGLTGSIGMGKSTAARMARRLGVPVHDADATVHGLMAPGGAAVAAVAAAFPGVRTAVGGIDRKALGARVFGDGAALKRLEAILHPLVRRAEGAFLRRQSLRRAPVAVLDIPLLFETAGERRCDLVVVVTAPAFLQAQRVLARPGMTAETLRSIRGRQAAEGVKRLNADRLIQTGRGRGPALRELGQALKMARQVAPRRRPRWTYLPAH